MTVLITGGSQGLGAAMAVEFAGAGYNVAINCYNQATVENGGNQTAEQCRSLGVKAECFIADVSDYSQCEAMVNDILEKFGDIDVLINNAGIKRDGLLMRMSEKNFDDVIAINMKGIFNMTKLVTHGMIKRRSGNIINISSVAGVHGNKGQFNYSASKAAVIGMTKSTAKELGSRNIICNAIAPGFIKSAMTDEMADEIKKKTLELISLGRYGTPEDVAKTALFLASQSYITGQVIIVDGDLAM